MCKHEEKYCPKCNEQFECKVGDIVNCQCYGIEFTEGEKKFISARFTDCLCAACMVALKSEYNIQQRNLHLKALLKSR